MKKLKQKNKNAYSQAFLPVIISWLEPKNLFQTFELQDEAEIEQEIKEARTLLDEDGS